MLVVFIIQLKYIHELDMMFNMMVDENHRSKENSV